MPAKLSTAPPVNSLFFGLYNTVLTSSRLYSIPIIRKVCYLVTILNSHILKHKYLWISRSPDFSNDELLICWSDIHLRLDVWYSNEIEFLHIYLRIELHLKWRTEICLVALRHYDSA